jgi:hypothetical protein
MKSPAPGEVMGIDSMLNQKGSATVPSQGHHGTVPPVPTQGQQVMLPGQLAGSIAPHPPQHHAPHHPPLQPRPPMPLARPDSPHGQEPARYPAPTMNGMDPGRPYGSPVAMHPPMHMPDHNMGSVNMVLPGLPPPAGMVAMPPGPLYNKPPEMAPAQPQPKAYPCTTCGKGFARRSDLARHGKSSQDIPKIEGYSLTSDKNVFTLGIGHTYAIIRDAGSSLSSDRR